MLRVGTYPAWYPPFLHHLLTLLLPPPPRYLRVSRERVAGEQRAGRFSGETRVRAGQEGKMKKGCKVGVRRGEKRVEIRGGKRR